MMAVRAGQPVWLQGPRGRAFQRYPGLRGRYDVEVAIVGGGMTGSAVAALFAAAGVRVAVLDARLAGRGSTAASTALLLREPDQGLHELGGMYGPSAARRIWRLSRDAAQDFVATMKRLRIDCRLARRSSVYYTTRSQAIAPLQAELRLRQRAGLGGEWLTPGALRRLTAIPGRGGILTRGNAQFDPYRASLGLLAAAANAGALVFERSRVTGVNQTGTGVRLLTAKGSVTARQVVIATGYAAPGFEPLAGRFRMHHTFVLATPPLAPSQRREIGFGDVMAWDTERPYHYLRWTPDGRLLLGGADRPVIAGRRRATALRDGLRDLQDHFHALLPALADVGIDCAWEGLFAMTPDSLPYIGPHRRYPRHLFALGYGGNGMTFGFMAARMLLEHWRGVRSRDHALFAFGRGR